MKMPELQSMHENNFPEEQDKENYAWSEEDRYDTRRSQYGYEAEPRREDHLYRHHNYLNSVTPQEHHVQEDDLAHAIIDTFS